MQILQEEGLRDARYRVLQRDDRLLVPVSDPGRALGQLEEARLVETELEHDPRRPPIEVIRERLADELPASLLEDLPTGWTRLGEVVVIRLPESLQGREETQRVAAVYAEELDVRSVLHLEGSHGERREPRTRLLWGEKDTETVHREHGITYRLDPSEVMFSAGNKSERHRLRKVLEPSETVVDLFAGIGYFSLPLAQAGARVIACEINPTAASYLEANAEANDLTERIDIREGDCRKQAPENVADRVMMGYLPGTDRYLACALRALKPEGGWIHYHDAVERPDAVQRAMDKLEAHQALVDVQMNVDQARCVKTLDPHRSHVVVDLEILGSEG